MSYTELESGYQGLRQQNRPGFYVGHDGNVTYVSSYAHTFINKLFLDSNTVQLLQQQQQHHQMTGTAMQSR